MISKEQYRKVLLKQIDQNTQKKLKEKQERKSLDSQQSFNPFLGRRLTKVKSFCEEKYQQSIKQNTGVSPHPKILRNRSSSKKRSKSGILNQDHNYNKRRNLLYWQNVDKQTVQQEKKKKYILNTYLNIQMNQNKERKLKMSQKQKYGKNQIQNLFKFNNQNLPSKGRKHVLLSNNLIQQKQPSSNKHIEIKEDKIQRQKQNYYQCKQQNFHLIQEMREIPTSNIVFQMEKEIILIKAELQTHKNNQIIQLNEIKSEIVKIRQQKQGLENQFKQFKKYVKYKLNTKSKVPQQPYQSQSPQFSFKQLNPKSQFYNESILNSSQQIPFCETKMVPILRESSKRIQFDKDKTIKILDSSSELSRLEIHSQNKSFHQTHLTKSQYIDKA